MDIHEYWKRINLYNLDEKTITRKMENQKKGGYAELWENEWGKVNINFVFEYLR